MRWLGWFIAGCTGSTGTPLAVVADGEVLPAALLSVWAGAPDDVWIVGADPGSGPTVLHWSRDTWEPLDPDSPGDLWWVWSDGGDTLWMVGDHGRALQLDRPSGTWTEHAAADPAYKLFGVWGSADDDVYAVGGDVTGEADGIVVHWNGSAWSPATTAPGTKRAPRRQAFKVWGSGPRDVWVVGTGALVMHFDGTSWTELDVGLDPSIPLTTVHGASATEVFAVGGVGNATVLRFDGTAWTDDSPPPRDVVPALSGVFGGDGPVACGNRGTVLRRASTWEPASPEPVTALDLHACALDPTGEGLWAVGGDLVNLDEGVILYEGPDEVTAQGLGQL